MSRPAGAASAAPPGLVPGLVYVSDESPGIRRLRRGAGFAYLSADGKRLSDTDAVARIRRLAIPPAYTDVWICPLPHGHLQATGRDARGRKQYRYHADWRQARDDSKFDRLLEFGSALPRIRARVARDLAAPIGAAVSRDAVMAAIVRLLDTTLVRVGNDEYLRSNGSYGLTTLRNRHAAVQGSTLRLKFRGKSGVTHDVALDDRRVARVVRRCQALPGQELFQCVEADGTLRSIGSADVNAYLRDASGGEFSAKDFRTWHGTVHALALHGATDRDAGASAAQRRIGANLLLAEVARRLGNTVAVCRKAYVHPRVLDLLIAETAPPPAAAAPRPAGRTRAERGLVAFLKAPGTTRRSSARASG